MHIAVKEHIKLRNKYSTFIRINNEPEALKLVNSFGRSHYHDKLNMWELPYEAFKIIVSNYNGELIIHELPPECETILSKVEKFEEEDLEYIPKTPPFQHQVESMKYSKLHNKFLLADEQGLGKTKQAIDIALSHRNKFKHTLIICGVNGLKYNWRNEIAVHSNEKGYILGTRFNSKGTEYIEDLATRLSDLEEIYDREEFFIITNVETLRDTKIQKQIKQLCDAGVIGMTIIDEIHKCKNSQSSQGKAIHSCTSYYKLALTGTPLMNDCIDLYNILKWLEVENHTLTQWKNYYCEMGGFGGYQIVGYNHMEELQQQLDSVMLRRKKEDVLDLPPKIYTNEYLLMSPSQQAVYDEIKVALLRNVDKIFLSPNPLVELTRLRQATGYTGVLSTSIEESCKIDRMIEIVKEVADNNGKCVIFSNWTSVVNPAYQVLCDAGFNPAIATGEVKDIQQAQTKFKTTKSCKAIIGTIGVLGTGFTLTEGQTVIFLDEPWNMATKMQAEDRCHRIGTNGTVNIITLICKDTIDERIHTLITKKGMLSDTLVDNKFSIDDIKYLLS